MFVYIYVCKHQITYIILLIKHLQKKTNKKIFKHVLLFFGFRFYKLPNILIFKHKRTEYKKEKGQLSHTIKKSRADRSSRQKTPTSLLHSININKKHTSPKVTYKDQIRKDKEIADN